ncbi:hypothetical protein [Azospirillum sp.]|uniref:hypothetical protein n=1 Tax=Azospirillum sp. TaxID=34012 RepID=UPI0026238E87|nr:hypothetical protein [Azospirillum sp.]
MFDAKTARFLTILLTVLGAVFAGMGVGLYVRAARLAESGEEERQRAELVCVERLRGLGQVARNDAGVRLIVPTIDDPRGRLSDASALLGACPGWSMAYFCMGERCAADGGVAMVVDLARPR